jgi:hypothetical protein
MVTLRRVKRFVWTVGGLIVFVMKEGTIDMTTEQAMKIADKFPGDEVARLGFAIELLKANEEGYKEAMQDTQDCLDRVQASDPAKEKK